MNTPTLGVHLIVKNEAELLPRCLESLAGADEIVIVDTGSTDDSVAIARTYGAKVLLREWADDFSEARNAGLSAAGTDWLLVMDADEILKTPLQKIIELLRETKAEAFTVDIENWFGSRPEERLNHRLVRLFRNRQEYRYSGKIHEGVDAAIISKQGVSAIQDSDIGVVHFGYLPEMMARKNKISRNEHLLRLALAQQPEDDFYSYNLAVTCCQNGNLEEAEQLLRQTVSRAPLKVSYRPAMIRDLCKIYLALGKMSEIDALLARELQRYGDYPDLHFIQGQSWESQGLPERAFQSYQQAAALCDSSTPSGKYVREQGMCTFRPLHRMGVLSQELGQLEEAARYFHRSLQHYSLYAPALLGIAAAFQRLAVPDNDIAALLVQLVPPEQAAARTAVITTLFAIGAYEAIAGLSQESFPLERDTLVSILSAWIIAGKVQEAENALKEHKASLSGENVDQELLQQLWKLEAICHWEMGKRLPQERLLDVSEPFHKKMYDIDQLLSHKRAHPSELTAEPGFAPLITTLIELSVKLQRYGLAASLAELSPAHTADLAAALYEEGRLKEAGELFIDLVRDKRAEGKVLFYIGEMLFDKGHYSEAAGWFQQLLEESPGNEAARIGLSLCYLQLGRLGLEEVVESFKEDDPHSPLLEDIAAIRNSMAILNRTPWHTQWSYRQRQGGTTP
ncbi:glycosyltransferase [Paenibacillus sp. sgz500992]|uniref:glycosyltransferase n=1 Tax=Paenibacillus sp. sgz500992 TaxID=3242476 RepID=UPI0036D39039